MDVLPPHTPTLGPFFKMEDIDTKYRQAEIVIDSAMNLKDKGEYNEAENLIKNGISRLKKIYSTDKESIEGLKAKIKCYEAEYHVIKAISKYEDQRFFLSKTYAERAKAFYHDALEEDIPSFFERSIKSAIGDMNQLKDNSLESLESESMDENMHLNNQMDMAVYFENYEKAAKIRDKITKISP